MVFDVSVGQIALVFLVGSAVLGPKDLPRAARACGQVMGTAVRFLVRTRTQAEQLVREAQVPELKQELKQSVSEMERIRNQIQQATRPFSPLSPYSLLQQDRAGASTGSRGANAPYPPAARASTAHKGPGAMGSGVGMADLRADLEAELKSVDANKGATLTERIPSGADVVVEVLRQQRFIEDYRKVLGAPESGASEPPQAQPK